MLGSMLAQRLEVCGARLGGGLVAKKRPRLYFRPRSRASSSVSSMGSSVGLPWGIEPAKLSVLRLMTDSAEGNGAKAAGRGHLRHAEGRSTTGGP